MNKPPGAPSHSEIVLEETLAWVLRAHLKEEFPDTHFNSALFLFELQLDAWAKGYEAGRKEAQS